MPINFRYEKWVPNWDIIENITASSLTLQSASVRITVMPFRYLIKINCATDRMLKSLSTRLYNRSMGSGNLILRFGDGLGPFKGLPSTKGKVSDEPNTYESSIYIEIKDARMNITRTVCNINERLVIIPSNILYQLRDELILIQGKPDKTAISLYNFSCMSFDNDRENYLTNYGRNLEKTEIEEILRNLVCLDEIFIYVGNEPEYQSDGIRLLVNNYMKYLKYCKFKVTTLLDYINCQPTLSNISVKSARTN